jgi:hypothetical protein
MVATLPHIDSMLFDGGRTVATPINFYVYSNILDFNEF